MHPRKFCEDEPAPLDVELQEAIGEYAESKNSAKIILNPPNADTIGESIELLFFRTTIEHNDYKKLQAKMAIDSQNNRAIQWDRIKDMYQIQEKLRRRFIETNYFLKECNEKERIAQATIVDEMRDAAKLQKDRESLMVTIKSLGDFHAEFRRTLKQYEHYEKILQEVVEKSDIYVSIEDCMARCDALMLAQVEIKNLMQIKSNEIEVMRQRMLQVTQNAALFLLRMQTDLTKCQHSHENATNEVYKWEKHMEKIKSFLTEIDVEKNATVSGITAVYNMLRKRRNLPTDNKNTPGMMNFIYQDILIMRETLNLMESKNSDNHHEQVAC